jgi:hypothetical protein
LFRYSITVASPFILIFLWVKSSRDLFYYTWQKCRCYFFDSASRVEHLDRLIVEVRLMHPASDFTLI